LAEVCNKGVISGRNATFIKTNSKSIIHQMEAFEATHRVRHIFKRNTYKFLDTLYSHASLFCHTQ
jgi:hypothetical protein